MNKAVFFKEWLKMRTCYLCMAAVMAAFTVYCLMRISRIVTIKDVSHIWELMIGRDMVFVDVIQYVFPAVGLAVAVAQFLPEMLQKRLKLTLHLPISQMRMTFTMLLFGTALLAALFAASALAIGIYTGSILAHELTDRILLTMLPWYLCGLAAYYLGAWILTEPTVRMKIVAALLAVAVLRMFYISSDPESYNGFLPWMLWITLSLSVFTWLSVLRFKAGAQD